MSVTTPCSCLPLHSLFCTIVANPHRPPPAAPQVRNERVKLALHQAGEFGTQADQAAAEQAAAATASASGAATAMDTGAGDALDARLALYDKAINALAEAKSHVRNAVKGLAGERG